MFAVSTNAMALSTPRSVRVVASLEVQVLPYQPDHSCLDG